jgi:hypothetical protein
MTIAVAEAFVWHNAANVVFVLKEHGFIHALSAAKTLGL